MLNRMFPRVYEGWLVVGSSAFVVLLIGASFFYGFGTIFSEVINEFGWSVASTSLAFSLRSEVGGVIAPVIGTATDRMGARRVVLAGIVFSALGVLAMSYIQTLWHFYGAMLIIACGSSASGGQVGLVAIASWFERRRGLAMSIMTIGGGLGGVLVVGIAVLVDEFGWRMALRILALLMVTVGALVASNIRTRPAGHPQPMDGAAMPREGEAPRPPGLNWGVPVRRVWRTRSFLYLSLGMIAISFSTTAVAVHQIPYLERELGISKAVASSSVALFTLVSIPGRLLAGYLADRYPKRLILAGCTVLIAVGLPLMAFANSYPVATAGILIVAPGFGGSIPVRPALFADYYGTKFFGTVNGIGALVMTTGGAVGPWVVGRVVDQTGSYDEGWVIAAAVTVVAIPLFLLATPPKADQERAKAEAAANRASAGAAAPPTFAAH